MEAYVDLSSQPGVGPHSPVSSLRFGLSLSHKGGYGQKLNKQIYSFILHLLLLHFSLLKNQLWEISKRRMTEGKKRHENLVVV